MRSSPSLLLFLMWLSHYFVDAMIGVFPVYKTMAHLDLATAGFIAGACAFIGEGMQIFFGPLSDRGYRKLLISCGLAATVASALFSYTADYFCLFCFYLIVCLGSGAFHPAAASFTAGLSKSKKGLYVGIFTSGGALGMASSQLIFTNAHSWTAGNTICMAIPTLFLAASLYLSKAIHTEPANQRARIRIKDFADFFKRRDLSSLYITQICTQSVLWSIMFLLPDILVLRGYDDWVVFGGGHMFYVIGGGLMMIPAGFLADRFSCRTVLIAGMSIGALLLYIFVYIPGLPQFALCALLLGIGACIGMINPVAIAFGNKLAPENPGMVSAFLMGMVWCLAEAIGQTGGGLLTKLFQENAPAQALGIMASLLIIGTLVGIRLPAREPARAPVTL